MTKEPEKIKSIDAEYLSGQRFPYQEDIAEIEDVDLLAATPGETSTGSRTSSSSRRRGRRPSSTATRTRSIKIYFPIPDGREDEIARKVLVKHSSRATPTASS